MWSTQESPENMTKIILEKTGASSIEHFVDKIDGDMEAMLNAIGLKPKRKRWEAKEMEIREELKWLRMNKKRNKKRIKQLKAELKTMGPRKGELEVRKGSLAYNIYKQEKKEGFPKKEYLYEHTTFRKCSACGVKMLDWKGCPCKTAWYCNRKCQKKHYKEHKKTCSARKTKAKS